MNKLQTSFYSVQYLTIMKAIVMKRKFNNDGQQFHHYQHNEQSPLTSFH